MDNATGKTGASGEAETEGAAAAGTDSTEETSMAKHSLAMLMPQH